MMDYRDFLIKRKLMLKLEKELSQPANIVQSRNHLLSQARGSLRQHLQRQLTEALQKFNSQKAPRSSREIV